MSQVLEAPPTMTFTFNGCADLKLKRDAAQDLLEQEPVVLISGQALEAKMLKTGKRKRALPTGIALTRASLQKISTKWLLVKDGDKQYWISSLTPETTVTIAGATPQGEIG